MKHPINMNHRSITSIALWFGITIIIGSFIGIMQLAKLLSQNPSNWAGWILLLGYFGLIFFVFIKLKPTFRLITKWEAYDYRLQEERVISEVISQDYRLLEMKIKEDDHNMKIKEYNKGKSTEEKMGTIEWRKIEDIARQAVTPDFYKKTYDRDILGNKNNSKKKK